VTAHGTSHIFLLGFSIRDRFSQLFVSRRCWCCNQTSITVKFISPLFSVFSQPSSFIFLLYPNHSLVGPTRQPHPFITPPTPSHPRRHGTLLPCPFLPAPLPLSSLLHSFGASGCGGQATTVAHDGSGTGTGARVGGDMWRIRRRQAWRSQRRSLRR
jgi:hypothetical protein